MYRKLGDKSYLTIYIFKVMKEEICALFIYYH